MKKIKIAYWIVTLLLSAFMLLGAMADLAGKPDAAALIKHLNYPEYFMSFIGTLKVLGIIAILIPNIRKVKEWAYAGLVFDTFGAMYSHLASGDQLNIWAPALIGLILVVISYVLYTFKTNTKENVDSTAFTA